MTLASATSLAEVILSSSIWGISQASCVDIRYGTVHEGTRKEEVSTSARRRSQRCCSIKIGLTVIFLDAPLYTLTETVYHPGNKSAQIVELRLGQLHHINTNNPQFQNKK